MPIPTVSEFRLTARENDPVRIAAPEGSMARQYNGREGYITGFEPEWWVIANVGGQSLRFRPDELQLL